MIKIIIMGITSFILAIMMGKILIPIFKNLNLGQYIREDAPKEHKKKSGVATFGAFIFIIPILMMMLFNIEGIDTETKFIIISFIIFAFVGFIDDFLKKIHKRNEGLDIMQKFILLTISITYCVYYLNTNLDLDTSIIVPFIRKTLDLKVFYIPFISFMYMSMTNAVNLTDGLDGLAGGVSVIVITFLGGVSFIFRKYLVCTVCVSLVASLLGFLKYNIHPAKIIMGDTGSLALGGVITSIAIVLKLQLIVPIIGMVYLIEVLSTVIQIVFFKITGKRFFRMAPIHHALELGGWSEVSIVNSFYIVTAIMCLIGFLALI